MTFSTLNCINYLLQKIDNFWNENRIVFETIREGRKKSQLKQRRIDIFIWMSHENFLSSGFFSFLMKT